MRRVWLAGGLGLLAFGAWKLLFGDTNGTRPAATGRWALGALIAHDGLLAPAVFVLGWLVARVLPARLRPVATVVALPVVVLAGVVTLLAIPRWRSPAPRQNDSVWPPLSTVDILLAVLVGLAALAAAQLVAFWLSARARRSSAPPGATGR
jgi:hypothetical protein